MKTSDKDFNLAHYIWAQAKTLIPKVTGQDWPLVGSVAFISARKSCIQLFLSRAMFILAQECQEMKFERKTELWMRVAWKHKWLRSWKAALEMFTWLSSHTDSHVIWHGTTLQLYLCFWNLTNMLCMMYSVTSELTALHKNSLERTTEKH